MEDPNWRLLASRYVGEYKVLRLREDRYRFAPTGGEADFVVCESSDWAVIVPITADGQVVFVRQYRHGVGQQVLEFPGGVLEPGESPEVAAARELREETGFVAERVHWLGKLMPNAAINNAWMHVVVAEGCRQLAPQAPDPFEQIDVLLFPEHRLHAMVRQGELAHALMIAALAMFEHWRRDAGPTS